MSNMKLAGKTPMCVNPKCRKFYSLKKMNENQINLAHETGLCSVCQANAILLNTFSPVEKTLKPGVAVREALVNAINKGLITPEMLANLCDKNFTLKNTGIKYAFLKKVDKLIDFKSQTYIYGKARYSTKIMTINNEQFLMTNDIYKRNVDRFLELMK